MKKNRWKKGIALFLSITAIFTGSMIPVQASEYWRQATGNGISVCDGDGDEHGSCII